MPRSLCAISIAIALTGAVTHRAVAAGEQVVRGKIITGTTDSAIGDYSFMTKSTVGSKILTTCNMDDTCEVRGRIDGEWIRSVASVKKIAEQEFVGEWVEEGQQCPKTFRKDKLAYGQQVFDGDFRYHFEGKCKIVTAAKVGAKWELDERCVAGREQREIVKAHWSITLDKGDMTAIIKRAGSSATPPFHMKRCG